jgi:hypothetical protein
MVPSLVYSSILNTMAVFHRNVGEMPSVDMAWLYREPCSSNSHRIQLRLAGGQLAEVSSRYIRCPRSQHPLPLLAMTNLAWSFIRPCNVPTNLLNKGNSSFPCGESAAAPPPSPPASHPAGPDPVLFSPAYSVFIWPGVCVCECRHDRGNCEQARRLSTPGTGVSDGLRLGGHTA